MPVAFFLDENTAAGATPGLGGPYEAGVSNVDSNAHPDVGVGLPSIVNPIMTYLMYDNAIDVELDAGMALHKPLPQSQQEIDHLGLLDLNASGFAQQTTGINLISRSAGVDVVQRMATSTYIFRLHGYAVRVAYPVPIPILKSVGGVTPVPAERQWATNKIIGSSGGIPVYLAQWDLWYYVTKPPQKDQAPPDNLAEHVSGQNPAPTQIQIPVTKADDNSVPSTPGFSGTKG